MASHWPGNARELERVIERAVALAGSDFLEPDDLPPALLGGYTEAVLPSLRAKGTMRGALPGSPGGSLAPRQDPPTPQVAEERQC